MNCSHFDLLLRPLRSILNSLAKSVDSDSKESSSVRFISRNLIIYDSDPKNLIPIDSNQKSKLNVKRSLCVKHVEKNLLQIMCYKIILFNVRLFLHIRLNSGGKKHFLCSICNKQFDIVFNLLIQRIGSNYSFHITD